MLGNHIIHHPTKSALLDNQKHESGNQGINVGFGNYKLHSGLATINKNNKKSDHLNKPIPS